MLYYFQRNKILLSIDEKKGYKKNSWKIYTFSAIFLISFFLYCIFFNNMLDFICIYYNSNYSIKQHN